MFLNEGFFRLVSVGLLGIVFISVTAMANKQIKKNDQPQNLFSITSHVEEAERINNGELHAQNLTSIGERSEVITVPAKKK